MNRPYHRLWSIHVVIGTVVGVGERLEVFKPRGRPWLSNVPQGEDLYFQKNDGLLILL